MLLDREVERISQSGALGRSPVYARLLRYLYSTTQAGSLPKEADIAVEVFDRKDFDSSSDSSVRVYLHNLRQKLNSYYEGQAADSPQFVYIPKGEYRLAVGNRSDDRLDGAVNRSYVLRLAAFAAGVIAALIVGVFAGRWIEPGDEFDAAAASELWRPIASSDKPLVVVLGDYYIFGEIGEFGNVRRLIRDFRINSADQLDADYGDFAADGIAYTDMRLSYLPVGTGAALADILSVVRSIGKDAIVIPESSLDVKTVQSNDIVYIGYLSGLGLLKDFVFASSNFELGATFDELVQSDNGALYVSEAGLPDGPAQDYVDYGFMSTFGGPSGNQILVVAGMRDEGLMQMASILSSEESIVDLIDRVGDARALPGFEALYRVRGMNRMNIASRLVFAGGLKEQDIWIDSPKIRSAALPETANRENDHR